MIRSRLALAAGLLMLALGRPAAAADDFARSIRDLPLMPGLTERADSAVVFDKPTGRIVELSASGPVEAAAVLGFYRQTLPQLGWRPAATAPRAAQFVRAGETLSIAVEASPGAGTTVRFSLAPR